MWSMYHAKYKHKNHDMNRDEVRDRVRDTFQREGWSQIQIDKERSRKKHKDKEPT